MKNLSFKQHLIEMPLPADWDKNKIGGRNSFASQIKYAKERSKQVGAGSSRVAFVIPYEGRQTVLKVAKNSKGLAQNDHETQMFNDYYFQGLGIGIPMIDHDEENDPPSWIHTEFAGKAKPSDFIKATGLSIDDLIKYTEYGCGKQRPSVNDVQWFEEWTEKLEDNDLASSLIELVGNYGLPTGDFRRIANWGIYDGRLVIIDLGLSQDIFTSLYSKAPPKQNNNRW